MIQNPFGEIELLFDDRPLSFSPISLPFLVDYKRMAGGRYAVLVEFKPDGKEHQIFCHVKNMPVGTHSDFDPTERVESVLFWNADETTRMNIACYGEIWEDGVKERSREYGFDYDISVLPDGIAYEIKPNTKAQTYLFGICWEKEGEGGVTLIGANPIDIARELKIHFH